MTRAEVRLALGVSDRTLARRLGEGLLAPLIRGRRRPQMFDASAVHALARGLHHSTAITPLRDIKSRAAKP